MEIDARDGSLDADILFLDLPDELRESHPAHVVARFFSDLTLNNVKAAKEFREKLDLQLSNLVEIVTRANSLTPAQVRDISYFAQGYAAGYTDRYR